LPVTTSSRQDNANTKVMAVNGTRTFAAINNAKPLTTCVRQALNHALNKLIIDKITALHRP
jgi:hypothetical protein